MLFFSIRHERNWQKCIISPQRAIAMAKNIFVGGDLKRLRAIIRHCKKDEQRLAQNIFSSYNQSSRFLTSFSKDVIQFKRCCGLVFIPSKIWLIEDSDHSSLFN